MCTELDSACCKSKQSVVLTAANIVARVEVGAALTHDDFSRVNFLTTETLHAKALRVGVATVTGTGYALFGCHFSSLLPSRNVGDLDRGELLTVALAAAVAGLVLVLQDIDLWSALVLDDLGRNLHIGKSCRVGGHRSAINHK